MSDDPASSPPLDMITLFCIQRRVLAWLETSLHLANGRAGPQLVARHQEQVDQACIDRGLSYTPGLEFFLATQVSLIELTLASLYSMPSNVNCF